MRVFIGFKYQDGNGEQKHVPVLYGDMTRQVANLITENSENKLGSVPKISCYIVGIELDRERISDQTFVSKIHVRERNYEIINGERVYGQTPGGNYTVERLMPSPYKLSLKADILTSNTDQKLQLLEQILMMFHPSLELQTTDNYVDWTSLSVLDLNSITFSSRSIPTGTETEIDVATLEFSSPIWISAPAKVKKLGIIKNIIMNIFTDAGDIKDIESLVYNADRADAQVRVPVDEFGVYLLKNPVTGFYECSMIDRGEVKQSLDNHLPHKIGFNEVHWDSVLEIHRNHSGTSRIFFQQPSGYEVSGTFSVNPADSSKLIVTLDVDTIPANTEPAITAIINPTKFNPIIKFGSIHSIPAGTRYLILASIGTDINTDGPDAWKDTNGADTVIRENSIIEWSGTTWIETFNSSIDHTRYVTNLTTGIQYQWDGRYWFKSFEGEYPLGYWRLNID